MLGPLHEYKLIIYKQDGPLADFLFAMLCAHAIDLFLASVYESLNEIRQNMGK